MELTMKFQLLLAAYLVGVMTFPAAATITFSAEPALATRTVRVGYIDLDLGRARDVARLRRRIDHAVTRVCMPSIPDQDRVYFHDYDCRRNAMEMAIAQFNVVVAKASQMANGDG